MSEDTDQSQKTEEPTPKKINEARERGQVAVSREVNTWMMLLVGAILIAMFAPGLSSDLKIVLQKFIEQPHLIAMDRNGVGEMLLELAIDIGSVMGIPILAIMVIAVATGLVQNGFMLATKALEPKLEKFNPIKGAKRMFSARSVMEFVKGIVKIAIVGTIALIPLLPLFNRIDTLPTVDVGMLPQEIQTLVLKLLIGVLAVLFVIAIVDLIYQRYEHKKQLRMTKQEVKDEVKQTEGDPQVRMRLRKIRMERATRRMMQAVPDADVVVTNPTHYAIAMRYKPLEMEAPVVVAKGQDLIALKIREIAEEHDITIVENAPLAQILYSSIEIDEEVPEEHYKAVAEIISYVWNVKGRTMPGAEAAAAG